MPVKQSSVKHYANKLDLSENRSSSKRINTTCWDRTVEMYEKETGISSPKCPLYLGATHTAVTAAVKLQVLYDGS